MISEKTKNEKRKRSSSVWGTAAEVLKLLRFSYTIFVVFLFNICDVPELPQKDFGARVGKFLPIFWECGYAPTAKNVRTGIFRPYVNTTPFL